MNANELMLGNYVKEIATNRIGTILYVDFDKTKVKLEHSTLFCPIDMIEPIPLTEKWLLDFGFKSEGSKDYLFISLDKKDECYLYFNPLGKGIAINQNGKEGSFEMNIKFVHQLQNLYFFFANNHLQLVEPK